MGLSNSTLKQGFDPEKKKVLKPTDQKEKKSSTKRKKSSTKSKTEKKSSKGGGAHTRTVAPQTPPMKPMNQMSAKTLKYILACSTEKGCETKEQIDYIRRTKASIENILRKRQDKSASSPPVVKAKGGGKAKRGGKPKKKVGGSDDHINRLKKAQQIVDLEKKVERLIKRRNDEIDNKDSMENDYNYGGMNDEKIVISDKNIGEYFTAQRKIEKEIKLLKEQ